MSRRIRAVGVCAGLALAMLLLPAAALAMPHSGAQGLLDRDVCSTPAPGRASCDALIVTNRSGALFNALPASTTSVAGYHPADLQNAYQVPSATAGKGQTVAIVDAYNDPRAASDLATYRSYFGLPAIATCSVSSGRVVSPGGPCFAQVGQTGSPSALPADNASWSQEISLDLDMVSAICPNCNILLVEASTASMADLGSAVNEAASLGANEISNSYGSSESSSDPTYDSQYYDHPGIAITVSSGDNGYGTEYPAASPNVTAVGGTTLTSAPATSRGWIESAWSGAGSGCSAYDQQPSWQSANPIVAGVCTHRAVTDVSADADPHTGVSVYDSYAASGNSNWLVFGGTSVASPIVAGVYALAGNAAAVTSSSYPYAHTSALNQVTMGSNGFCGGSALCTARSGWNGPTGLGTPNGTGAF